MIYLNREIGGIYCSKKDKMSYNLLKQNTSGS